MLSNLRTKIYLKWIEHKGFKHGIHFNLEKGARLSTYVSRCIDNEILMHLRATKKLGAEVYLNEPIRQRQR